MTLEEQITKLENEVNAEREKAEKLSKNVADQNSYITKLENEKKRLEEEGKKQPVTQKIQTDPQVTKFIQKMMKEKTIEEALEVISTLASQEVIDCLKPELLDFLKANMTIERTNTKYIVDAFHLIRGRAYSNKEHPINEIGKKKTNPPPYPKDDNILNQTPVEKPAPNMTPADLSGEKEPPKTQREIKDTKDAFLSFKQKMMSRDSNL